MTDRTIFCIGHEDLTPNPIDRKRLLSITEQQAYALKADLGFDAARLTIFRDKIAHVPDIDKWDWEKTDGDVQNLRLMQLLIYTDIRYCPAWASEGKPTYQEGVGGSMRWRPPGSNPPTEFADDREWVRNPPHIDPEASWHFGAELGKRHGRRSIWVYGGVGVNEIGQPVYWAPIWSDPENAVMRAITEVIAPMIDGIRTTDRTAQFAGPEADNEDVYRQALQLERDLGLNLFDAGSSHIYPWSDNWQNAFKRIDEFEAVSRDLLGHRPRLYSECGGMDPVDFVRGVFEKGVDVRMIGIHDRSPFFEPGTWVANNPKLSAKGKEMKSLIAETTRGRSVRWHL